MRHSPGYPRDTPPSCRCYDHRRDISRCLEELRTVADLAVKRAATISDIRGRAAILSAHSLTEVEEAYAPYKKGGCAIDYNSGLSVLWDDSMCVPMVVALGWVDG